MDFTQPLEESDASPAPRNRRSSPRKRPGQSRRFDWKSASRLVQQEDAKSRKTDWRPLFSYTANLDRLGEAILNTDAAWVQIGRAYERRRVQVESMAGISPGGWSNNYDFAEPANERRLAELWRAAISLDLVGRRPGRPLGAFPMHLEHASEIAGPPAMNAVVEFDGVSKWYGNVIGLNKLTVRIAAGVTGLLGPNGAGKSTMLQLATGQLRPSQGEVRVLGHRTWNNAALMRHIGLCPEQDAFYEWMTGLDFVRTCAG